MSPPNPVTFTDVEAPLTAPDPAFKARTDGGADIEPQIPA